MTTGSCSGSRGGIGSTPNPSELCITNSAACCGPAAPASQEGFVDCPIYCSEQDVEMYRRAEDKQQKRKREDTNKKEAEEEGKILMLEHDGQFHQYKFVNKKELLERGKRKQCHICNTATTPEWRRGPKGAGTYVVVFLFCILCVLVPFNVADPRCDSCKIPIRPIFCPFCCSLAK